MTKQVTTETQETETTQEVAQPEVAKAPDLNLNDLVAMRNLIEVVTQRGAFKANELSAAGQLFDKLNAFLTAAEAQAQANQPAQGE
jgi:hypothetical protein